MPAIAGEFAAHPDVRTMGAARELYGRRKDGSELRVEIGLTPLAIADDLYVLASVTDISERLRLEQVAALQREELAHLSRVYPVGRDVRIAGPRTQPATHRDPEQRPGRAALPAARHAPTLAR